jgi:Uma2 family endonuclease
MATVLKRRIAVQPDVCMSFSGVGWAGLEHAKALAGEQRFRITYADGDLLLMSPGLTHEAYVDAFRDLVKAVGRAFRIPVRSLGAALWERPQARAAKMPDASFYIASAPLVAGRIPEMETDPVPDLVIEVEITNPITLALRAYANMRVPEVWHFARRPRRAASLRFLRLQGKLWVPTAASIALPMLQASQVLPLIEQAAVLDELERADLLRTWIRDELRPGRRRPGRG